MPHTRQAHLCDLLAKGHPFKVAVILTAIYFKVPAYVIEQEFYR